MTVMVTGASGPVGRALIPRLVAIDEVRAVVRDPAAAEPLRALGAKVAVDRLDDAGGLAEILRRVYTVIHLAGGPRHDDVDALFDANHGSTLRALSAAKEAGVRRFLLVSAPGASPDAADPFLRAKGLAEEAVVTSGLEHAVIRSAHVYGLGGLWFTAAVEGALARPPVAVGRAGEPVAPVWAADLAGVIVAADDRAGVMEGTWALEGPDPVTPEALVGRLAGGLSPARFAMDREALGELLGMPVAPWTAAWLASPARADAPDAGAAFGVERTTLAAGLRRTLADAAEVTVRRAAAAPNARPEPG